VLTVEDVGGPLTGPSTAVGAALEQVRRVVDGWRVVVAVGVVVAALDAARRVPGRPSLRRTGARPDGVHTAQEPTTIATARRPAAAIRLHASTDR